jgi:hypothetical protein
MQFEGLWLAWKRNRNNPDFSPFLTYQGRDEYLEWAKNWKQAYAELSQSIREDRNALRHREGNGPYETPELIRNSRLVFNRQTANAMLALRRASKADSWAKKQAALTAV